MGEGELIALVEELQNICAGEPSPNGGLERGIAIEQRLLELLSEDPPASQQLRSPRVACRLEVLVRRVADAQPGVVTDFGHGGMYVATELRTRVGERLEIEVETPPGATRPNFCVGGEVAWVGEKNGAVGVGVRLDEPDEATQQDLWSLLIGLLHEHGAGA